MELLINNTFYKVEQAEHFSKLQFVYLTNKQKVEFEKWFRELMDGNIILKRVDLNILSSGTYPTTAFLIDDSKVYEIKGMYITSVGDASSDFSIHFDSKNLIKFDLADLLKETFLKQKV